VTSKYYRSPIDKLVVESNFSAAVIAEKMGIKYHRMVALRRLKDVKDVDLERCKKAIEQLNLDKPAPKKRGRKLGAKVITQAKSVDAVLNADIKSCVKPESCTIETQSLAVAYMLGKTIGYINALKTDDSEAQALNHECSKLFFK